MARDQRWAESDVDVGALMGPGGDLASFAEAAERELGLSVDVVDLRDDDLPIELLRQITRDGIDVFAACSDIGSRFRAASLWAIETDAPMLDRVAREWLRRVATEGLR